MRFLPVFLDLAGRDVVLVGSSEAIQNKYRLVLAAAPSSFRRLVTRSIAVCRTGPAGARFP
jgi:hypothetical protein